MPQSLSEIYLHIIFSTKGREAWLSSDIRDPLYNYMAGILKNLGVKALEINGVTDHVHVLCLYPRVITVADMLREIKSSSTKWLKGETGRSAFAWQAGYGAFSVSHSDVGAVRNYIQRQEEHHREKSFQEEYRQFLERYEVDYDEEFVWD